MLLRSCKSIIARRDSTYCRVNCNAIGSRRAGVQFVTNINPKSCRIPSSLLRQFGFCSQVKISRDISRILNYSNSKPSPQCLESSHCRLYHAVTIPVHAYVKSGSAPSLAYSKSRFRPLHDLAKAQTAWGLRSFQISKHSSSKVLLRCITSSAQDFGHLPMDANLQSLISSIHKAPEKAVVYVTGGGLQVYHDLMTTVSWMCQGTLPFFQYRGYHLIRLHQSLLIVVSSVPKFCLVRNSFTFKISSWHDNPFPCKPPWHGVKVLEAKK